MLTSPLDPSWLLAVILSFLFRTQDRPYVPPTEKGNSNWETVDPASEGWDEAALADLSAYLASTGTRGFLILLDGRILFEEAFHGWPADRAHRVFSVTKSMVATMVRELDAQDVLDLEDPVSKWLGLGWTQATASDEALITIGHLMRMTSGLDTNFRKVADPGEVWFYNTAVYRELWDVIESATTNDREEYAKKALWLPLGMHSTRMAFNNEFAFATTRDLARFGLAMSRAGRWDADTAVLSRPTDVAQMTATSQKRNPVYGELWWVNGQAGFYLPGGRTGTGPLVPSAPTDLFAAFGAMDQKVYVSPSQKLVVVRVGANSGLTQGQYNEQIWQRLQLAMP